MKNILFMCVANSARSQMAEGLAKKIFGSSVHVESSGSNPGKINPLAIAALSEVGIDAHKQYSKSCDELPASFIENLDYVITLCAEEVCPVIITKAKKLHWPLPDPANANGDERSKLMAFRDVRDKIASKLEEFSNTEF